ncbi:MAG TPA: Gfo/Idh/MocA family oxidoreductase [Phycisphaerae bacterium]|jgi:predicted dehydrogenase|nr:Gfo/Idh/MocA family oxidoreductase [Phycisphaerae bacterium]
MPTHWESGDVNAAVIGVGRMGQHHARNYAGIPGYKLLGVVDTSPENARKAADGFKCRPFGSVQELLTWCKESGTPLHAASVAVPTIFHRSVAEALLPQGVDLLIEKPLAPSVADAKAIVDLARAHKRILQVGHTERFNPAYRALKKYALKPAFIEVQRISPMTFRSIDVGVVLDMMIHDIDIVAHLVKRPVVEVRAVGVAVIGKHEDLANARLTFENGCVATLTASRLALRTERKMRLFSPAGYVSVDYQKKAGAVIAKTANEKQLAHVRKEVAEGRITDLQQFNYQEYVKYEDLVIEDREPVKSELENFLEAIRTRGATPPEVTGEDGMIAVDIATRITQCVLSHKWEGIEAP